jgi:von Willebrand factor type A domain-containing protein
MKAAFAVVALVAGCSSSLSSREDDATGPGASSGGVIFGDDGSDIGNVGNVGASAGGDRAFDGPTCAGQTAGAESLPAVLELLVDTSGSMDEDAPGTRGSKWDVTRRAMLDAIAAMPPETSVGVTFYPNVPNDNDTCFDRQSAVAIDVLGVAAAPQRQAVSRAFQRQAPQGGTPTHDAYRYAISQVLEAGGASRYIVLITDGVPTYSVGCVGTGRQQDPVDPTPLIAEAAAALTQGIRTFVIGSPGSEGARDSLSRMAEAGGTAAAGCSHAGPAFCHFDMTRERDLAAGLGAALDAISSQALSCQYELPRAPAGEVLDPTKVNVLFTPRGGAQELIGQTLDPSCSAGWRYSQDFSQIQLCAATCELVKSSDGALSLEFGCVTQVR